MVAADANDSKTVTTLDLIIIRRVVLGLAETGMERNFKFPTESEFAGFPGGLDTFPQFTGIYDIGAGTTGGGNSFNFIGIKTGDVTPNCNVATLQRGGGNPLSEDTLVIPNTSLYTGIPVSIPVYHKDFSGKMLMSLGLAFNDTLVTVQGVQGGALPDFSSDCFIIDTSATGSTILDVVWLSLTNDSVTISPDSPLFYIQLLPLYNLSLKDVVELTAHKVDLLAATPTLTTTLTLELEDLTKPYIFGNTLSATALVEGEAYPNPFTEFMRLGVSLNQSDKVQVSLFDPSGRMILQQAYVLPAGNQVIEIDQLSTLRPGIYYYEIATATDSRTGKLLKQ